MNNFNEAEQARLSIKMTLSNYYWYQGTAVIADKDEYCVVVYSRLIDDKVRKIIPNVHKNVSVKIEGIIKNKGTRG